MHLCQPDSRKSCAACCGIYNFIENERDAVAARLSRNRDAVSGEEGCTEEAIAAHSRRFRPEDNGRAKRFAGVFNCEFAGFLDAACLKVGCLLHPQGPCGRDLRDRSFYGRELCDGHYCLSYHYLSAAEQRLVVDSVDDWYLYGLTITDIDLVKGWYALLSERAGEALKPERLGDAGLKRAARRLFALKLDWPFRPGGTDRFGKYLFRGESYEEIKIPYASWGRKPSPFHRVLIAFGSDFENASELESAEALLEGLAEAFVRTYTATGREGPAGNGP